MPATSTTSPGDRNSDRRVPARCGLKMPYNWDFDLLEKLGDVNRDPRTKYPIAEVYAARKFSILGSGRTASTTYDMTRPIREYVEEAHRNGIRFEYLWNAITIGGKEWDADFQDKLYEEAKTLVDAGVDGLTITNPLLCLKMKKWFPQMKVSSSVNNHLDSVERIQQAVDYLDIDRLMLDNRHARNVHFVSEVHKAFPTLPIIVLVNEACLPECVLQAYHQEHTANASRSNNDYDAPDLCRIFCTRKKLQQPVYTLKAPWVRPEDLHYLFEAGASLIKLAGRTERSEWMVKLAQAYAFGEYDGDIWELIEKPGSVRPEWDEVMRKKVEHGRFRVDNKSLDGFIEPFVKGAVPCVQGFKGCGTCRWCDQWMHAVTSPANLEERIEELNLIFEEARKGRGEAP